MNERLNFKCYWLGVIILLVSNNSGLGQVIPLEGAKLNYTQIMFDHPQMPGAEEYLIELGLAESNSPFERPVAQKSTFSTACMISNLEFGRKYIWKYTAYRKGNAIGTKGPFYFEILSDMHVDRGLNQVRILLRDSTQSSGGLIALDVCQTIVDRNGNFVWFLPVDSVSELGKATMHLQQEMVNDLRITPFGTVTLMNGERPQERNLNGRIVWQAPPKSAFSNDSIPAYDYHHCLRRLSNGNYMVLDRENVHENAALAKKWGVGSGSDDQDKVVMVDEVIREFDKKNNLVWKWSSENYFNTNELKNLIQSKPDRGVIMTIPGGHMNAFDVDEKNGFIYAGFRNVSRVIKIEKKTEQVVMAWGNFMSYQNMSNGDGFFLKQHETTLLRNGNIAVYNNGQLAEPDDTTAQVSSVVVFTQEHDTVASKIAWKFDCNFDSIHKISVRGGSVDELKNGNLLVCMGSINRVFEVTRDKRIVWSAVVETRGQAIGNWSPMPLFKTHYASSLYPCYFTIQTSADTLNKKALGFELKVFNDGTESDWYEINVTSPSGLFEWHLVTEELISGSSVSFRISPKKMPSQSESITVLVQSKTNPNFKRVMNLKYVR